MNVESARQSLRLSEFLLWSTSSFELKFPAGASLLAKRYSNDFFSSISHVQPTVVTTCSTVPEWLLEGDEVLEHIRVCA